MVAAAFVPLGLFAASVASILGPRIRLDRMTRRAVKVDGPETLKRMSATGLDAVVAIEESVLAKTPVSLCRFLVERDRQVFLWKPEDGFPEWRPEDDVLWWEVTSASKFRVLKSRARGTVWARRAGSTDDVTRFPVHLAPCDVEVIDTVRTG